jgi:hypothetical protein
MNKFYNTKSNYERCRLKPQSPGTLTLKRKAKKHYQQQPQLIITEGKNDRFREQV